MATLSSSSTSQSYYLRFSSHSAALSRSLLSLLSESYCTDVHISTGHQSQTIRAHKLILSAFSPYFKSLFSSLPNNQFPVIIIRDINYDILRTIIEFCYRGEILVSRDKLDDIVSAAKFLQIEGAKDFILPKPQSQQQQTSHQTSHTSATTAKMQIDLQAKNNAKSLITQQQSAQQKTMSLLSKMVQKPPINLRAVPTDSDSMPIISSVRHINEKELEKIVKIEDNDEEVDDEEEDDDCRIEDELNLSKKLSVSNSQSNKKCEKSGMFAEFEDQGISNNKSSNNEPKLSSCNDNNEEPMDTSVMGHILAKVPAGTSVSTTSVEETSGQPQSDNLNVPTNIQESDEEYEEDEEEEDDFDEEEGDSTNPLDICNVNLSETEESHQIVPHMDTSLHLSSATARAIAASTFASFNTMDLEVEPSTSAQSSQNIATNFTSPQSISISPAGSGERRGRGRPPKYGKITNNNSNQIHNKGSGERRGRGRPRKLGSVFSPHATPSPAPATQTATTSSSSTTSMASSSTRSRRGRPPSMPEELLRSLTGRLDKAHHKCPHCPQIYYGYHAMRDHITSVHLNSGEKYICNLCNKEYTWRITLRKHLKFHHGVHPDQVPQA